MLVKRDETLEKTTFAVKRKVCGGVDVLSFLVSETEDDVSLTWPNGHNVSCSRKLNCLSGTVHVAGFAFQAFFVTNEQMIITEPVRLPASR